MIAINGRKLDFQVFPNGETRLDTEQILRVASIYTDSTVVTLKYENDSDLLKLMFVKNYLDTTYLRLGDIELHISYMPYSRMDRSEDGSAFTLKYVADFINNLNFDTVAITEPHSDVTMALIDRSYALYPTITLIEHVIEAIEFNKETDYLFFPDAGAQKRYGKLEGFKTAVGYKKRDFATGKITDLQVIGGENIAGAKVLILDDLCSYGGTFILSGKELRKLGAQEVYLFVAHAEESIFKGTIFSKDDEIINKVFTTDTILDIDSLAAKIQAGIDCLEIFQIV